MNDFGKYLKELRSNKGISLSKVYGETGITDSRLSKAENSTGGNMKLLELKKLAELYEVSTVSMCLAAGLFSESDIEDYRSCFRNVGLLDDDDKIHVQSEIDYLLKKKG